MGISILNRLGLAVGLSLSSIGAVLGQISLPEELLGEWVARDAGGSTTFKLERNGNCAIDQVLGNCLPYGGRITMKNVNGELSYNYRVEGNTLTFTGGDLDKPMVFSRVMAAAPPPGPAPMPGGRAQPWRNPDVNPSAPPPQAYPPQAYPPQAYPPQAYPSAPAPGYPAASAPELFGTWCYFANITAQSGGRMTQRCFTLNPDSTYTYRADSSSSTAFGGTTSAGADSGSWALRGNMIVVNSLRSGPAQYRLERRNHPRTGDPMLCLDGDCYVTATQRRPW